MNKHILVVALSSWSACLTPSSADPFYVAVSAWPAPPTYSNSEQAIFWVSGRTYPEQTAVVSGAFSPLAKTVRLASLAGASSAASAVAGSSLTTPGTLLGSTGLTFRLPKTQTLPMGPFAFQVEDSSGLALVGTANLPTIWWAQGQWSSFTSANSPLHEIRSSSVEAGGTLRIFGRDFPLNAKVRLTNGSGVATTFAVTTQNPYSLNVAIPSGQMPGVYTIQVGASASLDATYGPSVPLSVVATTTWTTTTVTATGLNGNGTFDNTLALQNFLDANLPVANQVKYISIPTSGTYKITGTITLHDRQYLVGATGVEISGQGTAPSRWIQGGSYWGLINIAVRGALASGGYIVASDTTNAGHVTLFGATVTATSGSSQAVHLEGPDIKIVNSTLDASAAAAGFGIRIGSGVYIAGTTGVAPNITTVLLGNGISAYNPFGNCKNVIVENVSIAGNLAGSYGSSNGMTFYHEGNAPGDHNSGEIYVGNCSISDIQGNNREALTPDGAGSNYVGKLSSVSALSVVLANAPDWNYGGLTATPSDRILCILAGKGQGQYRHIASASGNTITLTDAWTILPDTNSVVTICGVQQHLIYYGNYCNNTGAMQFYAETLDGVMDGNVMVNTGGIVSYARDYNGAQPIFGVDLLNNNMIGDTSPTNQAGDARDFYWTGVHLRAQNGAQNGGTQSGALYRNNIAVGSAYSGVLRNEGSSWATRIFATLEEDSSAPTSQALGSTYIEQQNQSLELKENFVSTSRVALGTAGHAGTSRWLGLKFTTGTRPITVTSVGRWKLTGNTGSHTVKIVDGTTFLDIPGASAVVPTSSGTVGRFTFAALASPITLAANKSYYVVSQELVGSNTDNWYDANTRVSPGGCGIHIDAAAEVTTTTITEYGGANNAFGPVNLQFEPEMPLVQAVSSLASSRHDVTSLLGFKFTVGPTPMTVTQLGRWIIPGNSGGHTIKITTTSGSDVPGTSVTCNTSGAAVDQFAYVPLPSPVVLSANTSYYLQSQETNLGDSWYDKTSVVVPTTGAAINSAAWANNPSQGPNNTYIPVNLLSTY